MSTVSAVPVPTVLSASTSASHSSETSIPALEFSADCIASDNSSDVSQCHKFVLGLCDMLPQVKGESFLHRSLSRSLAEFLW